MAALQVVRRVWTACRQIGAFFPAVAVRHLYHRARRRNIVASGVRIMGAENIDTTGGRLQLGMLFVGFMDAKDRSLVRVRGKLQIRGPFSMARGCRVDIGPGGVMSVGSGYVNANTTFVVMHGLRIGYDCAIAWGCTFLDDDMHALEYPGRRADGDPSIAIGDHVWIGSNVSVLKGADLPNGSVVAAGSVVKSKFTEENTLIAGNPARVVRKNVSWR